MAALVGLLFLAVPTINGASPSLGDASAAAAGLAGLLPVLSRAKRTKSLSRAVLLLFSTYLIGTLFFAADKAQAMRHTETTGAAGIALLLFATYGKDMLEFRWFRRWGCVLVATGIAGVNFSGLPKNITGGSIVYLLAFSIMLLIRSKPRGSWFYASAFFVTTGILAVALDFRSLIGYTAIVMFAYLGSLVLSRRTFWAAGIAGCVAVVGSVTWYFLHAYTSPLAVNISQHVLQDSGRRATSGRDVLWPAIANYVHGHQWFGRGVDKLPKNFMVTTLSSHSYYMQEYLQLGMLGLALVIVVLLTVWKTLSGASDQAGRFGAALFLMFVVHNGTEVLMFENGLIASIPAWCSIGLAYALVGARVSDREVEPVATKATRPGGNSYRTRGWRK
jgi:hypothetical protein